MHPVEVATSTEGQVAEAKVEGLEAAPKVAELWGATEAGLEENQAEAAKAEVRAVVMEAVA